MSYVLDNLLPNEFVKYEGKVHGFYTWIMIIWALFWFLIFIWWGWVFWLAFMIPFIYFILFIYTTEIVVTNKRVLYKTWVIARNVFELQLMKVESVRLDQTIFQRIIWSWKLIVSWTGWHYRPIEKLANPTEMRTIIYWLIEELNK